MLVFLGKRGRKTVQRVNTTAVGKDYGFGRRTIFSTEGSFGPFGVTGGGSPGFVPISPFFFRSVSICSDLSVLKRCVPKTLAFAFGLRLRSKTRCFKTRVLGRRLPNGKPQERLRLRDLHSKTLAFKKRIAIVFCDLLKDFPRGQGLRSGPLRSKNAAFCVCVLKPTRGVAPANQTKEKSQFMNFSQGHSGTKVQCESCLFS